MPDASVSAYLGDTPTVRVKEDGTVTIGGIVNLYLPSLSAVCELELALHDAASAAMYATHPLATDTAHDHIDAEDIHEQPWPRYTHGEPT